MEKMNIEVIPYLSFKGRCEEAVNAYLKVFGGEILYMTRWSEDNFDVTPQQIGKVMHAEFILGNTRMSAGDIFDCKKVNTDVKLMVHMNSRKEAEQVISGLAERAAGSRLQPHPDNSGYGSVFTDRFGFTWIITCPN